MTQVEVLITAVPVRQGSGHSMTVNVEYNQLDPLLRATSHPDGDVNDDTGFSPFPGAHTADAHTGVSLLGRVLPTSICKFAPCPLTAEKICSRAAEIVVQTQLEHPMTALSICLFLFLYRLTQAYHCNTDGVRIRASTAACSWLRVAVDQQLWYRAGNINQLVLKLKPYAAQLEKTGGVIAEFVNPKCAAIRVAARAHRPSTRTPGSVLQAYSCEAYPSALSGISMCAACPQDRWQVRVPR